MVVSVVKGQERDTSTRVPMKIFKVAGLLMVSL